MTDEYKPDPDTTCTKCNTKGQVRTQESESSCGGYDIYRHECDGCGHHWNAGEGPSH